MASSVLDTLSGSFQTAPMFFLNWQNGVNYNLAAQAPQYDIQSLHDLQNIPVTGPTANGSRRSWPMSPPSSARRRWRRSITTTSGASSTSTPTCRAAISARSAATSRASSTPTAHICRAAVSSPSAASSRPCADAYVSLVAGLGFSILLVYLLIVVNFQSWLDPFIIITALPAALAGIVLCLFFTGTTLSVPALMGAIMCMGVATANSILVVSFARERLAEHGDAVRAAIEAGFTRFRPVLMTALAMIIGMVPMALGLGEGGEQNAPLGRAVIGGLLLATVATLVFVPAVFSLLHAQARAEAGGRIRRPDRRGMRSLTTSTLARNRKHSTRSRRKPSAAPPAKRRRKAVRALLTAVVVARAARRRHLCRHSRPRATPRPALATDTSAAAVPVVDVVHPQADAPDQDLVLPGQTIGLHRHADLRAHQRLSEALVLRHRRPCPAGPVAGRRSKRPELDQQLRQARADLVRRGASQRSKLAGITARPHREPAAPGQSISTQDDATTPARRAIAADQAIVAVAQQANVDRLEQLTVLENVYRAVRRRDHRAQHRCRRPDQCGRRRCRPPNCST